MIALTEITNYPVILQNLLRKNYNKRNLESSNEQSQLTHLEYISIRKEFQKVKSSQTYTAIIMPGINDARA